MTTLGEKYNEIIRKLEEKQETHPNLTNVWKQHIISRKTKFENDLIRCNNLLELLERKPDISLELLHNVSFLMRGIYRNNT